MNQYTANFFYNIFSANKSIVYTVIMRIISIIALTNVASKRISNIFLLTILNRSNQLIHALYRLQNTLSEENSPFKLPRRLPIPTYLLRQQSLNSTTQTDHSAHLKIWYSSPAVKASLPNSPISTTPP